MKRILPLIILVLFSTAKAAAQMLIPEPTDIETTHKTVKIRKIVEVVDTSCGLAPEAYLLWMREPARITLKAGWNTVRLVCPCLFKAANWHAAFIPVKQETGRNISEATGLKFNGI